MKYQLVNYFDVWGNAKEGFEVNNQCVEDGTFYIDETATNKDICKYLQNTGYLTTCDMRRLSVINWGDMIEVTLKNGKPLFCFQPIQ